MKKKSIVFSCGILVFLLAGIMYDKNASFNKDDIDYDYYEKELLVCSQSSSNSLLYGFINKKGQGVLPVMYNDALLFTAGIAAIKLNKKWALIDNKAKILTPFMYDQIEINQNGLITVRLSNRWGVVNKKREVIIPVIYDLPILFKNEIACVQLNGKYGYIDSKGNQLTAFQYDYIEDFNDEVVNVCIDNKWGIIDKHGKTIQEFKHDYISDFNEGLASYKINNKWGFLDRAGREIITAKYDYCGSFYQGLALVVDRNKYGYINDRGKIIFDFEENVMPSEEDYITDFINKEEKENESLRAINAGKFIDKDLDSLRKKLLKKYTWIYEFQEGMAKVIVNGKLGLINKTGKEVVKPSFKEIGDFSEGLARVLIDLDYDHNYGFIDKKGKIVIPPIYPQASDFHNGLARVCDPVNGNSIFIDKKGKEVIKLTCSYNDAGDFDDGIACFSLSNGSTACDTTGKMIDQEKYSGIGHFHNGLAIVSLNSNWYGYINRNGTEVIPAIYNIVEDFQQGMAKVTLNYNFGSRSGYIDKVGKIVIPLLYKDCTETGELILVSRGINKYGFPTINPLQVTGFQNFITQE